MAAKRPRTQAKKRGGRRGPPGWWWLLGGVLLTAVAFVVLPRWLGDKTAPTFLRPQPDAGKQPPPAAADDEGLAAPESATPAAHASDNPTGAEAHYDFYTLLPGKETALSDADVAARASAEQQRANARHEDADTAPDTASSAAVAATATRTPAADDAGASTPAPATVPAAASPTTNASAASADTGAHYLLQAGAYQASGDAEALKAKIALLGLGARVESAQIGGKTVYRVRLGPYGSARELAAAKQTLQASGLQVIALRAD